MAPSVVVDSVGNDRVKGLRKLHRRRGRRTAGLTLLEGPTLVDAARHANADVAEIWALDDTGDIRCSPAVLAAISTTETPQTPVAVLRIPPPAPLRVVDTVVLWDVADPGNVGALIRSAAAFGWAVAVTPACADPWSPKVLRAGAGGHFATSVSTIDDTSDLRALHTIAAVAHGGSHPADVAPPPRALLIGNEAAGLPERVLAEAAQTVTIPFCGAVESLNASVAGAILMWALTTDTSGPGERSEPPPSDSR